MGLIHPNNLAPTPHVRRKTIAKICEQRMNEWFFFIGDHAAQAARAMQLPVSNIYGWKSNGRISPKGALLIEQTWPKSKFKASYLRPDVVDWDDVRERKSAVGRY